MSPAVGCTNAFAEHLLAGLSGHQRHCTGVLTQMHVLRQSVKLVLFVRPQDRRLTSVTAGSRTPFGSRQIMHACLISISGRAAPMSSTRKSSRLIFQHPMPAPAPLQWLDGIQNQVQTSSDGVITAGAPRASQRLGHNTGAHALTSAAFAALRVLLAMLRHVLFTCAACWCHIPKYDVGPRLSGCCLHRCWHAACRGSTPTSSVSTNLWDGCRRLCLQHGTMTSAARCVPCACRTSAYTHACAPPSPSLHQSWP